MKHSWGACLSVLTIAALGCGSSKDVTVKVDPPTTQPATVATKPMPTSLTTTTLPSPYRSAPIRITYEDWPYIYSPRIGKIQLVLEKRTEDSPPGMARVQSRVLASSVGSEFPGTIVSATPERNAPDVGWGLGSLMQVLWPLDDDASVAGTAPPVFVKLRKIYSQGCGVEGTYDVPPFHSGGNILALNCSIKQGVGSWQFGTEDIAEADADALIRGAQMLGQPYVQVLIENNATLPILLSPSGECFFAYKPCGG